jgi:membrane associated rhomboid family serine protease
VAYAAHVGGFIFGAVAARLFTRGGGRPEVGIGPVTL